MFTSFILLTPLAPAGAKEEKDPVPVNGAAIFYLEKGIRKKDEKAYTVIHSTGGDKLIVIEDEREIIRKIKAQVQHFELAIKGK